jgi:TRAP-type transport system periplasmic protein
MKKYGNKKIWLGVSICVLVIFGSSLMSFAYAAAAAKPLVIHDAAMSRGYTKAFEWWAQEVEKQTNGEVTFKFLWGGPLGGYPEALDSLKNSVYDLSMASPSYAPSQLPMWTGFEVPFVSSSQWAISMAMYDMMEMPALKREYDKWQVKVLIPLLPTPFEVMSSKPVKKLADFKGLKIRAYGMFADVLRQFGAQCVSIAAYDTYENMQRGVVEAAIMPWPEFFVSYRVYELSKYSLDLGGFGYVPSPFCISMNAWNQISKKNQDIMLKLARQAVDKNIEISQALAQQAFAKFRERKIEENKLSPAEKAQMVMVAKQVWEQWIAKQEKDGHKDARLVLETIVKKAKEYEAKDPFKK